MGTLAERLGDRFLHTVNAGQVIIDRQRRVGNLVVPQALLSLKLLYLLANLAKLAFDIQHVFQLACRL